MDIKYKNSGKIITNTSRDYLPSISELKSEIIKIIKDVPCFYLEDKKETLAVHYRKCRSNDLAYLNKIIHLMENFIKDRPLDLLKMSNVIEIKPENINKGRALITIKKKYRKLKPSIDICIGDDVTDNYLFRENKKGINIKVGTENPGIIETEYFLKNVDDVLDFLNFISDKL
jgi:trehalose-phosphatase